MEYQNENSKKKKTIKTSISLAEDVMKKVDEYCEENYLNRSVAITVLLNEAFKAREQQKIMNKFLDKFSSDPRFLEESLECMKKEVNGEVGKTK